MGRDLEPDVTVDLHLWVVAGGAEVRVEDTGRLFMRNLPYTATQADLAQLLEAYGELSEVHLVVDR